MLNKVAFTMYPAKDATRARAFYENTLGLSRGSHSKDGVWTEYDLPGGGCFALFAGPGAEPAGTKGASIALEVDDLDAVIKKLESDGVRFAQEMIHSPVCRMSVIFDSAGNTIVLHELEKR